MKLLALHHGNHFSDDSGNDEICMNTDYLYRAFSSHTVLPGSIHTSQDEAVHLGNKAVQPRQSSTLQSLISAAEQQFIQIYFRYLPGTVRGHAFNHSPSPLK